MRQRPYVDVARETARVLLLAWMAAGCTTLQPRPLTPDTPGSPLVYDQARLTLRDGTWLELRHVIVADDSVTGMRLRGRAEDRVSVPVASVATLEQPRISGGRTALLVTGIALLALTAIILNGLANMDLGLGGITLGG